MTRITIQNNFSLFHCLFPCFQLRYFFYSKESSTGPMIDLNNSVRMLNMRNLIADKHRKEIHNNDLKQQLMSESAFKDAFQRMFQPIRGCFIF